MLVARVGVPRLARWAGAGHTGAAALGGGAAAVRAAAAAGGRPRAGLVSGQVLAAGGDEAVARRRARDWLGRRKGASDTRRLCPATALPGIGSHQDNPDHDRSQGGGGRAELLALLSRRMFVFVWAEAVRDEELAELARTTLGLLHARTGVLLDRLAVQGQIPPGTDTDAAARFILALLQGYVIQLTVLGDVPPEQVRASAAALLRQT